MRRTVRLGQSGYRSVFTVRKPPVLHGGTRSLASHGQPARRNVSTAIHGRPTQPSLPPLASTTPQVGRGLTSVCASQRRVKITITSRPVAQGNTPRHTDTAVHGSSAAHADAAVHGSSAAHADAATALSAPEPAAHEAQQRPQAAGADTSNRSPAQPPDTTGHSLRPRSGPRLTQDRDLFGPDKPWRSVVCRPKAPPGTLR